ncbi:hypothetical protein [Thalassotalea sp. G2M2-11]|uniref:hypothetical protein n=1 Tax=Thalassotalea sp. G2M2-11 TaxID=2787627 RepID=UPI0019CF62FA|nr:hypothetical protein [Thalassotalea sp. G2M2-11]
MHACNGKFNSSLNDIEPEHLEQCKSCQLDYELITKLRADANALSLKLPPERIWRNITKNTTDTGGKINMHITSDRLTESLSDIELLHIESCTQCKAERQKLPVKKNKVFSSKPLIYATAASIMMLSISWLMWSQHQLQRQLDEVLVINMMLEDKLNNESHITFQQAALVEVLREIDEELYQASSAKEKIKILQKRRQVIQQHFVQSKGDENEFSI